MLKVDYLSDDEYAELGLTSGIEIHQQIKTKKKLFCRCPVKMHRDNDFDAVVVRHMRPTLSELGEYDGTALMEFKTKKEVVYQLYHDCVCTYEMDDTPPFLINQDAVEIALEIAMLLKCTMIDEIFITRKQYLDGSIPTGFQRTAIVGINGEIFHKGKRIHIRQLGLEEDACREVSDVGHRITFKADRLGTPLIEVVTERDMITPLEVQSVAERIGLSLKATGLVQRGIGSVRQDVNVSITGSTRVEIKGVPRIGLIGPLVHFEALRQKHLLELRDCLAERGITPETLCVTSADITSMSDRLASKILRAGLDAVPGAQIAAVCLKDLAELLSFELQPGRPFAYEVSQRVKVIACLDAEPNIMYNDGNQQTGDLSDKAWERVFSALEASKDDAVIVVWGSEADVKTAISEIKLRVEDAIDGVPNETRQACEDGTTGFERILPGPDRMYPDTDLPPIAIPIERLDKVSESIKANPFETYERFGELGLADDVVKELMRNRRWVVFDRIVTELNLEPRFVASFLTGRLKGLEREGLPAALLSDGELFELFEAHAKGRLSREALGWVLHDVLSSDVNMREAIDLNSIGPIEREELSRLVAETVRSKQDILSGLPIDKASNALMGLMMRSTSKKLEPRSVAEELRCALHKAYEEA